MSFHTHVPDHDLNEPKPTYSVRNMRWVCQHGNCAETCTADEIVLVQAEDEEYMCCRICLPTLLKECDNVTITEDPSCFPDFDDYDEEDFDYDDYDDLFDELAFITIPY